MPVRGIINYFINGELGVVFVDIDPHPSKLGKRIQVWLPSYFSVAEDQRQKYAKNCLWNVVEPTSPAFYEWVYDLSFDHEVVRIYKGIRGSYTDDSCTQREDDRLVHVVTARFDEFGLIDMDSLADKKEGEWEMDRTWLGERRADAKKEQLLQILVQRRDTENDRSLDDLISAIYYTQEGEPDNRPEFPPCPTCENTFCLDHGPEQRGQALAAHDVLEDFIRDDVPNSPAGLAYRRHKIWLRTLEGEIQDAIYRKSDGQKMFEMLELE